MLLNSFVILEVELKYIYLMRYITLIIAMIPKHKQYPTVSNRLKDHFRNVLLFKILVSYS